METHIGIATDYGKHFDLRKFKKTFETCKAEGRCAPTYMLKHPKQSNSKSMK
jgi:hypothetical protein